MVRSGSKNTLFSYYRVAILAAVVIASLTTAGCAGKADEDDNPATTVRVEVRRGNVAVAIDSVAITLEYSDFSDRRTVTDIPSSGDVLVSSEIFELEEDMGDRVTVRARAYDADGVEVGYASEREFPYPEMETLFELTLEATGDPDLSLDRNANDFGSVTIGTAITATVFELTNGGTATSETLAVSFSGTNASEFSKAQDSCSGIELPPGASCSVSVGFAPTSVGAKTASLVISDGGASPLTATLTGTGIAPSSLSASPAALDFATVAAGQSSELSVIFSNSGGVATGALALSLVGTDAAQFQLGTTDCMGTALLASGSCTVAVRFQPSGSGIKTAQLQIAGTPGGILTVPLTGVGVVAGSLTVTPSTANFNAVLAGAQSNSLSFAVSNTGSVATGQLSVTLSDTANFALTLNDCSILAPAAGCTAVVRFNPTSTGAKTAYLSISDAAGGAAVATLHGTALAPATLTASPTSFNFQSVVIGEQSAAQTITFTNAGGVATGVLDVTLADSHNFTITGNTCAAVLVAGDVCAVSVRYTPRGVPGVDQTTLTASASPGGSVQVALEGNALAQAGFTFSPTNASFGASPTAIGATTTASFTVTNSGQVSTGIPNVVMSNYNDYSIMSNSCNAPLAAAATCSIVVAFHPVGVGDRGGTLLIMASPGGSRSASLYGTGSATLTVTKSGNGTGTVTSNPAGITCGNVCSYSTTASTVGLEAVPAAGSTFSGWSGAGCSGVGTCTVTMDAAKTVVASFSKTTYTLTVTRDGTGGGTVVGNLNGGSSNPISCGSTCTTTVEHGDQVTLVATRNSNSNQTNTGWSGVTCNSGADPQTCSFTMTSNIDVITTFTLSGVTLTVTKSGNPGVGTVTAAPASGPEQICAETAAGPCVFTFPPGTVVTLNAQEHSNGRSFFRTWTDPSSTSGCSGTSDCTVTLGSGNAAATAFFDYPEVPTGLFADATNVGQVDVLWNSVAEADAYQIYVGNSAATQATLLTSTITSGPYEHTGLGIAAVRYYKIAACRGGYCAGKGFSAPVRGSTPVQEPVLQYVSRGSANQGVGHLDASWTATAVDSGNESASSTVTYNLYRRTDPNSTSYTAVCSSVSAANCSFSNPQGEVNYFNVKACHPLLGCSGYSETRWGYTSDIAVVYNAMDTADTAVANGVKDTLTGPVPMFTLGTKPTWSVTLIDEHLIPWATYDPNDILHGKPLIISPGMSYDGDAVTIRHLTGGNHGIVKMGDFSELFGAINSGQNSWSASGYVTGPTSAFAVFALGEENESHFNVADIRLNGSTANNAICNMPLDSSEVNCLSDGDQSHIYLNAPTDLQHLVDVPDYTMGNPSPSQIHQILRSHTTPNLFHVVQAGRFAIWGFTSVPDNPGAGGILFVNFIARMALF